MSLSLLLEKYDVSTDEGLQKALGDIEKEEAEVDEALSNVLSKACSLEGRLRTASQAYTKLGEVKSDAQTAGDMVENTAVLARDVSAKVRQLDLARSRVAECQRRVHDLIDLQLCSAGVEAALKAHDYETGAAHVARYLCMDPRSVAAARARGAPDPRAAMQRAADALRDHLVTRFEEAARKEDEAGVDRLLKLFPQIGREQEGIALFAKYLATQTESRIRAVRGAGDELTALTGALQLGAGAAARARAAGARALPAVLRELQPPLCAAVSRVCSALSRSRLAEGRRRGPLQAEPAARDLALAVATLRRYRAALLARAQADAASLSEEEGKALVAEVEKILDESEMTTITQDLLGHYLTIERYFLEESVNKAIKMSTSPEATETSLVDDVFYIARKVIRRSISSGMVDGACAVTNDAASLLEHGAGAALRRALRVPPPDPLPLQPPPAGEPSGRDPPSSRDVDMFLAHIAEAECGAEWSERLATETLSEAERSAAGRADAGGLRRLRECAGGLGAAAAAFRAAHDLGLAGLRAALRPAARAWAHFLAEPGPPDSAEELCDALPCALDALQAAAAERLGPRAAAALLRTAVSDIAAAAEARMLTLRYDQESALRVERLCRRLATWSGANCGEARARAGRLAAAAAALAADTPAAPHLLPPAAAAALLQRRTDFKPEDIKRLKLT